MEAREDGWLAERKPKSVEVDYTIDGKNVPFKGTVKERKRKAVMNVSNPKYGSVKTVEKFDKKGRLTKDKIVDKDIYGKVLQVTKGKVDKDGNIYDKTKYAEPRKPTSQENAMSKMKKLKMKMKKGNN